jgi:hypothetical protein
MSGRHGLMHVLLLVGAALGLAGAALKGSWVLGVFFLLVACFAVAQLAADRRREP